MYIVIKFLFFNIIANKISYCSAILFVVEI